MQFMLCKDSLEACTLCGRTVYGMFNSLDVPHMHLMMIDPLDL